MKESQSQKEYKRREFLNQSSKASLGIMSLALLTQCSTGESSPLPDLETISILSPTLNDIWDTQSTQEIRWENDNSNRIMDLEVSWDNGESWQKIAEKIPIEQESYTYQTPEEPVQRAKVRILESATSNILAESSIFRLRYVRYLQFADYPELATIGTLLTFLDKHLLKFSVTRLNTEEYEILFLECTHHDCLVDWENTTQEFACPCHGSRFSKRGDVQNGPATTSLFKFSYTLDTINEQLKIFNV